MKTYSDKMAQKTRWRSLSLLLCPIVIALLQPVCSEAKTAQEFLAEATKPRFFDGHSLPRLTRWGWTMPFDVRVQLCEDWGYALEFGGVNPGTLNNLNNTNSVESRICALTASDPKRYPLCVLSPRPFFDPNFVNTLPESTWCHDADGNLILEKTYSPEMPDLNYSQAGVQAATSLKKVLKRCPVSIILNGGEYGLGVYGWSGSTYARDPGVLTAKGGQPWFDYLSARATRLEQFITDAVRATVPKRKLYIFYPTEASGDRSPVYERWWWWCWDYTRFRTVSDLPSSCRYYGMWGTWTGNRDMLSQVLNSTAQQIAVGDPLSYNWVSGGLYTNSISDEARYMGFLKCWYTAGMIGGIAFYGNYPEGGFGADFGTDMPSWLSEMIDLSHTHALFSYLEDYLRNGYLLPGPDRHRWNTDLPAYEFPAGNSQVRVLVRKHSIRKEWIVTAWDAGGSGKFVTVNVPDLGDVHVLARPCGSVYFAVPGPTLTLLDPDGMHPSQQLVTDTLNHSKYPKPAEQTNEPALAFQQVAFKNGTFSSYIQKGGGSISIHISSNLRQWQAATNFSGGKGTVLFQDVVGTNVSQRFYRSTSP